MAIRDLKIGRRLLMIVGAAVIGICALGAVALDQTRQNLMEDRLVKTRHVVEVVHELLAHYASQEASGHLVGEDARSAALTAVKDLRYDTKEYFWIHDTDTRMIMHPIKPALDGKNISQIVDPDGKRLFAEMTAVVGKEGAGFVDYKWNKPGSEAPVPKVSYVKGFAPWGWIVGSGIYIDDVDEIFLEQLSYMGLIALVVAGVVTALSLFIGRGITKPLSATSGNMLRLAEGDTTVRVAYTDQKDEIGDLARAMDAFKRNIIDMARLREEQAEAEQRAEAEKRDLTLKMADDFESRVGGIVQTLGSAATQMTTTAQSMSSTAEETSRQSTAVAAAAEEASANVQTVASASEQLAGSIAEIGRQVEQSTRISSNAVDVVQGTNTKIQDLSEAAQKIGEVVLLINDIADKTNLLALNATIEAARAGDAGKGFAVVAAEVKNLANQTGKATEEIGQQIDSVQGATGEAVAAMGEIGTVIGEVKEIATAIASAVEEQNAATAEIARNVEQAAVGTEGVTTNITSVNTAANETGAASTQVLQSAQVLSQEAEELRNQVQSFIDQVRAA